MQHHKAVLAALACAALGGCTQDSNVLFVTDTSLGINVDSKPPSVSVAYDRIEGYIAPRYDNGALPPVVASIQTGGNVFNPSIRQVYATGAAAVIVTGTPNAPNSPANLVGGRRLAFFGTSTSVGLKVGFDAPASVPDSFLFGYRRKEFSFIPLGTVTDAAGPHDTYASALASVDSNTSTSGGGVTGLGGVGLTHSQFIATGLAADTLATNSRVRSAFGQLAEASLAPSVTVFQGALQKISDLLPADPTAFKAALPGFVSKAYPDPTNVMAQKLDSFTSKDDLMAYLKGEPDTAELLASRNS
ncbi:MAG TPA: hypothetical protein VNU97_19275 [Rhizomicrobium sp.]|jgi:hypothetical protein|nr:hypothetical protein [Rhizomicrobium sp.]